MLDENRVRMSRESLVLTLTVTPFVGAGARATLTSLMAHVLRDSSRESDAQGCDFKSAKRGMSPV